MDVKAIMDGYFKAMLETFHNLEVAEIIEIYNSIVAAEEAGGKIYICGNGGSAATAMHFQNDLNMAFSVVRNTTPAHCLNANLAVLTALANDFSYDEIFIRQLKFLLNAPDMLIAISCSGNSGNVIRGAEYAKQKGCAVVSMVGFDGGKLKALSDYSFHVPTDNMQIAEDIHLLCCHLISTMIRESRGRNNAQP